MLEAIGRIQRYVGRKRRAGFLADALVQDAVIRNIEIVGEAAGRVSPDFAVVGRADALKSGTQNRFARHGRNTINRLRSRQPPWAKIRDARLTAKSSGRRQIRRGTPVSGHGAPG